MQLKHQFMEEQQQHEKQSNKTDQEKEQQHEKKSGEDADTDLSVISTDSSGGTGSISGSGRCSSGGGNSTGEVSGLFSRVMHIGVNIGFGISSLLNCLSWIRTFWLVVTDSLIQHWIRSRIVSISSHAAKNPVIYITSISMISIASFTVGYSTNFHYIQIDDPVSLAPYGSTSRAHAEWLKTNNIPDFPSNTMDFMFAIHDDGGKNILTIESVHRIFDVLDMIRSTKIRVGGGGGSGSGSVGGEEQIILSYDDVCSQSDYVEWTAPSPTKMPTKPLKHQKYHTTCEINSISQFWRHNRTLFQEEVHTIDDLRKALSAQWYPDGTFVDISMLMGHPYRIGETIVAAKLFSNIVRLPETEPAKQFEKKLLEELLSLRQEWSSNISHHRPMNYRLQLLASNRSQRNEFHRAIYSSLPWMVLTLVLFCGCTCVVFLKCTHPVSSTFLFGIGSLLTIFYGNITGMGLLFAMGVPFTTCAMIIPLIAFGVGLNDSFVITVAYLNTTIAESKTTATAHTQDNNNAKNDAVVLSRIQGTMNSVGISITMTTMATSFAFLFGSISSTIPAIHWLCLYAFAMITISFFYQITFFIALLVLNERCIQQNCVGIFCFWRLLINIVVTANPLQQQANHDDRNYSNTNNISDTADAIPANTNSHDNDNRYVYDEERQETNHDFQEQQQQQGNRSGINENKLQARHPSSHHIFQRLMTWYGRQLLRPRTKILVVVCFFVFFALCASRATKSKQQYEPTDLLLKDSYVLDARKAMRDYANSSRMIPVYAYFRDVDQSDPIIQEQMLRYIEDITSLQAYGSRNNDEYKQGDKEEASLASMLSPSSTSTTPICWIRDFRFLLQDPESRSIFRIYDNMTFYEQLDQFLSISTMRQIYGPMIARDDDTGAIIASRCMLFIQDPTFDDEHDIVQDLSDLLTEQRAVTAAQPINQRLDGNHVKNEDASNQWPFFVYQTFFLMWEFYATHVYELVQTTILLSIAVSIIGFIFIPHYSSILFIIPMMTMFYIELIGVIQMVGLQINVITFVSLVISTGLLVNFILRILLNYYDSMETSRNGKVQDALKATGTPIAISGLSMFLGILPLAFGSSSITMTVFVCFAVIIFLGLSLGLVLLPVLLSICGPINSSNMNNCNIVTTMMTNTAQTTTRPATTVGTTISSVMPDLDSNDIGATPPSSSPHTNQIATTITSPRKLGERRLSFESLHRYIINKYDVEAKTTGTTGISLLHASTSLKKENISSSWSSWSSSSSSAWSTGTSSSSSSSSSKNSPSLSLSFNSDNDDYSGMDNDDQISSCSDVVQNIITDKNHRPLPFSIITAAAAMAENDSPTIPTDTAAAASNTQDNVVAGDAYKDSSNCNCQDNNENVVGNDNKTVYVNNNNDYIGDDFESKGVTSSGTPTSSDAKVQSLHEQQQDQFRKQSQIQQQQQQNKMGEEMLSSSQKLRPTGQHFQA